MTVLEWRLIKSTNRRQDTTLTQKLLIKTTKYKSYLNWCFVYRICNS